MSEVIRILVAPVVWLASFSAAYGLHGLGCAMGWPEIELFGLTLFRVALVAAWAAAVLVQIAILAALRSKRLGSRRDFVRTTSLMTGWAGLAAALWTLYPLAVLSACV